VGAVFVVDERRRAYHNGGSMSESKNTVHTKGLHIAREIARASSRWPTSYAYLSDQARRASSSVVLNFAEGRGRASRKERERFFTIARGSVCETQACIELACTLDLVDAGWSRALVSECIHVSRALVKWGAR